jgi:hypothetical protein
LLCEPAGLEALEEVRRKLRGALAFQILFKTSALADDAKMQRFTKIQLEDAVSLEPLMTEGIYRRAHRNAMRAFSVHDQKA